ncbi:MAG: RES family NAD+ phosphorylase [Chitinophagaceae bacterium]|nr:RES family NAD+ phosphorylase [Chitinophagaceae bacterium]
MRKVYRISKCIYIDDMKGTGAATYGGRWHSKGVNILYTASTSSLALLESIVHLSGIPAIDYCMACFEIPEDKIIQVDIHRLPEGWNANPASGETVIFGDRFIRQNQYLGLEVPSVIMPEETNILLNPKHVDFPEVKVIYKRKIPLDERFFKT